MSKSNKSQSSKQYITGLSNRPNLHAKIEIKQHETGEGRAYAAERTWKELRGERLKPYIVDNSLTLVNRCANPPIRNGKLICVGLTRHARIVIRDICAYYKRMGWKCSFITLTFRHSITDEQAKQCLQNFMERLRRFVSSSKIHYLWVAEEQKRGLIHFHILTPERINKHWLNRAWNETVANCIRVYDLITKAERLSWQEELQQQEKYNIKLDLYRLIAKRKSGKLSNNQFKDKFTKLVMAACTTGDHTKMIDSCYGIYFKSDRKPKKPPKSKFLLFPNVEFVDNPSHYMAKYISKQNGKIIGNLWRASSLSRKESEPIKLKHFYTYAQANRLIEMLEYRLKKEGILVFGGEHEISGVKWIWTADGKRMMDIYYELIKLDPNEHLKVENYPDDEDIYDNPFDPIDGLVKEDINNFLKEKEIERYIKNESSENTA